MRSDDAKMVNWIGAAKQLASWGTQGVVATSVYLCNLIGARELGTPQLSMTGQNSREDHLTNNKGRRNELGSITSVLLLLLL